MTFQETRCRINGTQTVDQAGPRTVQFSLRYSF